MEDADLSGGWEPVEDGEILYRRVPVSMKWYDPGGDPPLVSRAFRPRRDEFSGISLTRAKYCSCISEAAGGPSKQGYFVALLNTSDLRHAGIEVVPKPLSESPGHCELPQLNANDRDSARVIELCEILAEDLTFDVQGPFLSGTSL